MEQLEGAGQARAATRDVLGDRSTLTKEIAIAFPLAIALWLGVFYLTPAPGGMADAVWRLCFSIKCSCVAVLFCFVTAIEAVAHERLRSPAIDPLSDYRTRRMRVNQRYLQNTLEQLALFVPGLVGLAIYCSDGRAMRAVVATTVVWIVSRIAFWIGYHYGSPHRAVGAPGMAQNMLVLLYVCARFGFDTAGLVGAVTPLLLFGVVEAFLTSATRPYQR